MLSCAIAGPSAGVAGRRRSRLVLEDRIDGTVGARTDLKRSTAGGLQPFATICLGQPQDADAGAETLLGVRALAQDDLDQRRGMAADCAGLPPDALRGPVGIAPVARRHVLAHRRVLAV